jgi:hypothetical protein
LLALSLLGCGSDDPNAPPPTSSGAAVVTSGTRTVIVENRGGGFIPQPPAGSSCLPGARAYTVTLATSTVDWRVCVGDSMTPYKIQSGQKVLSAAQLSELRGVLDRLKVQARTMTCAADAPLLTVTATTSAGSQEYIDDLDQCTDNSKPVIARSEIQAALDKLAALTAAAS